MLLCSFGDKQPNDATEHQDEKGEMHACQNPDHNPDAFTQDAVCGTISDSLADLLKDIGCFGSPDTRCVGRTGV